MPQSTNENKQCYSANWEHEFLIRLAPIWLACRWRIMGGRLIGRWPKTDLGFDLLGMCDYQMEMRLLLEETRDAHTD